MVALATNTKAREIAARLNKKMGANTAVLATDIVSYPRVTTGSLGLDVNLGGGWAANQWHEIIGEASAGKTNLAFATIAANQRRDPEWTAVWVAAEQFVRPYAEMCGVDLSRLYIVDTNIMEEAYDAALEYTESRAVDCVVIDSLPALVPAAEDAKTMEEATVGRGALLTGKFFRKAGKASKRALTEAERPVLGLCINQYRMKIGVMHGDPRTTPGGEGKNYAFFTRVEVRRDEWLTLGGATGDRIGQSVAAKTIKNKSAPPQRKAIYDLYFDDGGPVAKGRIDYAKEVVLLGMLYNYIERAGAWYSYGVEGTDGYRRWQGKDAVFASVREEPDLLAAIETEVLRATGAAVLA